MASAGIGDRVEGVHAVAAASRAGRVRHLYIESGRRGKETFEAVALDVQAGGGTIEEVEDVRPFAETSAPQGLVAEAKPIPFAQLSDLCTGDCALVVLDHLQDQRNAGAIARSAASAGMTGLVVSRKRSAPLGAAAFKAAAGALEDLPVAEVSGTASALRTLTDAGVWSVGLDAGAPTPLFGLDLLGQPVAVVVGAEGPGLSHLVRERVDQMASIPSGPTGLNASVAAALACYEVMRVRSL